MSLDRSLTLSSKLGGKRSVMKRSERIAKLIADKRLDPASPKALGLPKTLIPKA